MSRKRLDVILVERGLAKSRQQAQGLIMAGVVQVAGQRCDKPATAVDEAAPVVVAAPLHPYVGRGGLKLEKALDAWPIPVAGAVALDVGASTGGFTHCLLLRGASRVYAVDVGYGQLDWSLRQDPRVISRERLNARYLSPAEIPEAVSVATIDVSFISLSLILPPVARLLAPGGHVVALIKPQFEAGRKQVGRGGVVKDPTVHRQVVLQVVRYAGEAGLAVRGLEASPILGPSGNVEFLAWMTPEPPLPAETLTSMVDRVTAGGAR